ncbi:unnamed protein product [Ambrosiozyma monospora]|uniref:Unnamed protein product n=1 Tax=Ambrosiozyma monospora TaxID=43982 RepID=A0ACB5STI5_AMBMO|nr:unnamed protein product [Ambrosiozyma monospora]
MADIYEGVEPTSVKESSPQPTAVEPKREEPKPTPAAAAPAPAPTSVKKAEPVKEAPRPALTVAQEKGVDNMLKGKSVNALLDKVNNLSDDDTQEVDGSDNEWAQEKPKSAPTTSSHAIKKAESKPVATSSPVSAAPVKVEPKTPVNEPIAKEVSSTPSTKSSTASATATTTPKSAASKLAGATGGFKQHVEKLQSLVDKLEGVIEKLVESDIAKDERLKALEDKIDALSKK